ncbi:unnamed protein product [Linum tenue]|uniref:Uncharacterized protein n=1 Tax=Linum tenue TaxID=586396 RepID=A0AAV0L5K4_9ROSI|nr:unnamed protein product [Linum tenue]
MSSHLPNHRFIDRLYHGNVEQFLFILKIITNALFYLLKRKKHLREMKLPYNSNSLNFGECYTKLPVREDIIF